MKTAYSMRPKREDENKTNTPGDVALLIKYLKENKLSLICNAERDIEIWKEGKLLYKSFMLNC